MDLQGTKYYFLIKPNIILNNLNQDQQTKIKIKMKKKKIEKYQPTAVQLAKIYPTLT